MLNLNRFNLKNKTSIGEGRIPMGKKDDARLVSERAKSYFDEGFN